MVVLLNVNFGQTFLLLQLLLIQEKLVVFDNLYYATRDFQYSLDKKLCSRAKLASDQ